jgi:hypothetical protein
MWGHAEWFFGILRGVSRDRGPHAVRGGGDWREIVLGPPGACFCLGVHIHVLTFCGLSVGGTERGAPFRSPVQGGREEQGASIAFGM